MSTITITVHSTMKPKTTHYTQTLVGARNQCIHTWGELSPQQRQHFTTKLCDAGLIAADAAVATMEGWLLVAECLLVSRYRDAAGVLLGTYCDVVSLPHTTSDGYTMRDLVVDMWIDAAGTWRELDWDEYDQACADGRLDSSDQQIIATTMEWLRRELHAGTFAQRLL